MRLWMNLMVENMTILSTDEKFDQYGVRTLWK